MELDEEVTSAISVFFDAVLKLKELGVIRSDKYLGDIGEYYCNQLFEMELSESGRHPFDGIIVQNGEEQRCEVKYSNSPTGQNIEVGNPDNYDVLFVVLDPQNKLRSDGSDTTNIYKFTSSGSRTFLPRQLMFV